MNKTLTIPLFIFALFLSSCAFDFTQTEYPAIFWGEFSEHKIENPNYSLTGRFECDGIVISNRNFTGDLLAKSLGGLLFCKLPCHEYPMEARCDSISFETLNNDSIKVKLYYSKDLTLSEHVLTKEKDYFIKDNWIVLKESLYIGTAWEGQSTRLRVNLEGDLIAEVRDYGFGWYILPLAGNYNTWFRFKRYVADNEEVYKSKVEGKCLGPSDCPLGYTCKKGKCTPKYDSIFPKTF